MFAVVSAKLKAELGALEDWEAQQLYLQEMGVGFCQQMTKKECKLN